MERDPSKPARLDGQPAGKEKAKHQRKRRQGHPNIPLPTERQENYHLPEQDLYGGEVVIQLDHAAEEKVIPLHEFSAEPKAPAEKPATSVSPTHEIQRAPARELAPSRLTPTGHEQTIAPASEDDQPEKLPDDRRLENSIWHRIELDKKTGQPVKDPSLEYGREYYNERRREIAPHRQQVDVAAGEVALVADALNGSLSSQPSQASDIPSASTKSKLTLSDAPKKATQALKQASSHPSGGPLWPYVVILIAIIIAIILVVF